MSRLVRRSDARRPGVCRPGGLGFRHNRLAGATSIHIRITGDHNGGQLLGAQRSAEIAKRVDTYATALFHEMSVARLSDLDLSYTAVGVNPVGGAGGTTWGNDTSGRSGNRHLDLPGMQPKSLPRLGPASTRYGRGPAWWYDPPTHGSRPLSSLAASTLVDPKPIYRGLAGADVCRTTGWVHRRVVGGWTPPRRPWDGNHIGAHQSWWWLRGLQPAR